MISTALIRSSGVRDRQYSISSFESNSAAMEKAVVSIFMISINSMEIVYHTGPCLSMQIPPSATIRTGRDASTGRGDVHAEMAKKSLAERIFFISPHAKRRIIIFRLHFFTAWNNY